MVTLQSPSPLRYPSARGILFRDQRQPADMGADGVIQCPSCLLADGHLAASSDPRPEPWPRQGEESGPPAAGPMTPQQRAPGDGYHRSA